MRQIQVTDTRMGHDIPILC